MKIEQIRDALPDYARDLKLNLGSVLTTNGAPGLNEKQIWSIALASAIAARNTAFARSVEARVARAPRGRGRRGREGGRGHHGHEQHLLPLPAPGGRR